jgi:hypothetical protein
VPIGGEHQASREVAGAAPHLPERDLGTMIIPAPGLGGFPPAGNCGDATTTDPSCDSRVLLVMYIAYAEAGVRESASALSRAAIEPNIRVTGLHIV